MIAREFNFVTSMLPVLSTVRKVGAGSGLRVPDHIEATVDRYPDRPMAILDDGEISYREFEAYANRIAHWALDQDWHHRVDAEPGKDWTYQRK